MNEYVTGRARDKIRRLADQGLDLPTLWQEAAAVLARAVPHYAAPCWWTLDPASLLVTSHYQPDIMELPPEMLAHEYLEDDVHKLADVARSELGISTLHDVTGGDPSQSPGWQQFIHPYGADQEVLVALRTRSGETWGMLGLYREPDQPLFTAEELCFLREVAPALGEGARRGLLVGEATDPDRSEAPGLVILHDDWSVESLTPGVERWLAELPDSRWEHRGVLPPAVLAVAGRALRTAESVDTPSEVALARVLSRRGQWLVLHGAALVSAGARRVAVIIEPAHPARIAALLMAAYALTEREQEVTRLVLQGNATVAIATRLGVVPQTVQQHLKSIFAKTGVRSRRELVGKIFFAHYEPRLRDNEQRALKGRPLRGGPIDRRAPETAQH
ncbi:MAG: helix-turn-helix transcriptional regulator [Thermomicrobiales bacterium]|nr:helix-turn-helix transcriptional regulator [Thermomicrobiales bacterium]